MDRRIGTWIGFGALEVILSGALAAQDVSLADGFRSRVTGSYELWGVFERRAGGLEYSPDGAAIIYENGEIRELGAEPRVLASFDPPVYGDFLRLAPDGESYWFGESSSGGIWRVPVGGGERELIATLAYNFAIDFAPESAPEAIRGRAFVSATGSSTISNSVWLVEPGREPDEVLVDLDDFSGPLAFDAEGRLYYVTATFRNPLRLLRFSAEQVGAGTGEGAVAGEDAEEIAVDGFTGAYDLRFVAGDLILSNLGGAIERITTSSADVELETIATFRAGKGIVSPSFLAVTPGATLAVGDGPIHGGRIHVVISDFATLLATVEIAPELHFIRGEVNGSDSVDLSDAVRILDFLFRGADIDPVEAADTNFDGAVDLSDAVYLLGYLFLGGPAPSAPFPERGPAPSGGA
jgi:hypothetical protein